MNKRLIIWLALVVLLGVIFMIGQLPGPQSVEAYNMSNLFALPVMNY